MQLLKKIVISILTFESRLIVSKYKPFVVAVTGSVGKTSTKDAIYSVLKDQGGYVRKSEKSLNSEIGLPLTIIGVGNAWYSLRGWLQNILAGFRLIISRKDYPKCLVLEIGADHPNDIKKVVKWLHPDIAVITKISKTPVHVEFFGSPLKVFEEKVALAKAVKNGGTLVSYADDENASSIREIMKGKDVKILTYGSSAEANVRALEENISYTNGLPEGMSFKVSLNGTVGDISVKRVISESYKYPILAAAAVGLAKGIAPGPISKSLSAFEAPKGRMNVIAGKNGCVIIDDTYNSSPDAALSALETLKRLECSGTKIAVLGDMLELGKFSAEEHRKIGKEVAKVAGRLVTVGQRSKFTAEEALKGGMAADMVKAFDKSEEAADFVSEIAKRGDVILVKGSQSIRMERVSKALLAEPSRYAEVLVRQEKEWLEKK